MINAETGALTFPEDSAGARAAVALVNAQGGLDGHPLTLSVCATDNTADSSAGCANKLLADKPVAFIGGFDLGTAGDRPILDNAGIPTIGGVTNTNEALNDKLGFAFSNNIVTIFSGATEFAVKSLHAKKIVLVSLAQPSNSFTVAKMLQPVASGSGATVTLVEIPASATDLTASMAAALGKHPDTIIVAVGTNQCGVASSTARTLGFKGSYIGLGNCGDKKTIAASNGGLNNAYIALTYKNPYDTSGGADVGVFNDAINKYAPGTALNEESMDAFASVMNFVTVMKPQADNVTSAGIAKAFAAAKDVPAFLSTTFTCDKRVSIAPAVCSTVLWPQQIKNGVLVSAGKAIDGGSAVK